MAFMCIPQYKIEHKSGEKNIDNKFDIAAAIQLCRKVFQAYTQTLCMLCIKLKEAILYPSSLFCVCKLFGFFRNVFFALLIESLNETIAYHIYCTRSLEWR